MKSLDSMLEEALEQNNALKYEDTYERFAIYGGVKIILDKTTNEINIYNTTGGGDNYRKFNSKEMELFYTHGWLDAVHKIQLDRYKRKIHLLQDRIKELINTPHFSKKKYSELKNARKHNTTKYYKLLKRLQ